LTPRKPHVIVCFVTTEAAMPGEWRPIEAAPKDGSAIPLWLAKAPDRNYTVRGLCDDIAIGFWCYGGWKSIEVVDCGSMGGEYTGWMPDWVSLDLNPTHWMPLPEAPE
jgi:hypothetical protein